MTTTSSNWRTIFSNESLHENNNVKVGQRLGIPFTRSLQEKLTVKLSTCENEQEQVKTIELYQDGSGLVAISGVIWDCALHFTDYLISHPEYIVDGKVQRVLDLGCGTGICGLALLHLFPSIEQVILSDKVETDALENNLHELSAQHPELMTKTNFQSFTWNINEIPQELQAHTWDLLICSDLLYDAKCHGSLLECLSTLQAKRVLFAYKMRHPDYEVNFFENLSETYHLHVIDNNTIVPINLIPSQVSALYIIDAIRKEM